MTNGYNTPIGVPIGLPSILSLGLPPLVNPYPTLNLDFINNPQFDSRITFSRGSQATLFDSTGTLVYAKHNLLLQSQTFQTTWATGNVTLVTDSVVAPDGTTTADSLDDDSASGTHSIIQAFASTASITYVLSVFLKNGTRQYATVAASTGTNAWAAAKFDLSNGTTGSTATAGAGWSVVSSSIENVGNDWYRCILVFIPGAANLTVRIGLATDATTFTAGERGLEVYTGSDKTLFLWGAQLNQNPMEGGVTSSLTTYYPTTTAAYYAPRFDYNPSTLQPRGLLIEEQRTNSVIQSEDFAGGSWTKGNATVTSNTIVAPDGTLTGDKLVEDTATNTHLVQPAVSISYTSGTSYTYSVFAKAAERTFLQLRVTAGASFSASFDLSTGVASQLAAGTTAAVSDVGNGWYRCSITFTATATAGGTSRIGLMLNATTNNYLGDGTSGLFIWGAQLEAGAFATSYIPTTTTALTRNADVASMTGTNFSSWYNASEGTIFASALPQSTAATLPRFYEFNGASTAISIRVLGNAGNIAFEVQDTTNQASLITGTWSSTAFMRVAGAYKVNDFAASQNGGTVVTDNSGTVPAVTALYIGNRSDGARSLNGWISRFAYYPTRLPNTTLQALTA